MSFNAERLYYLCGVAYRQSQELVEDSCTGCAFAANDTLCGRVHRMYPAVRCSPMGSIFIEVKQEKEDAPS